MNILNYFVLEPLDWLIAKCQDDTSKKLVPICLRIQESIYINIAEAFLDPKSRYRLLLTCRKFKIIVEKTPSHKLYSPKIFNALGLLCYPKLVRVRSKESCPDNLFNLKNTGIISFHFDPELNVIVTAKSCRGEELLPEISFWHANGTKIAAFASEHLDRDAMQFLAIDAEKRKLVVGPGYKNVTSTWDLGNFALISTKKRPWRGVLCKKDGSEKDLSDPVVWMQNDSSCNRIFTITDSGGLRIWNQTSAEDLLYRYIEDQRCSIKAEPFLDKVHYDQKNKWLIFPTISGTIQQGNLRTIVTIVNGVTGKCLFNYPFASHIKVDALHFDSVTSNLIIAHHCAIHVWNPISKSQFSFRDLAHPRMNSLDYDPESGVILGAEGGGNIVGEKRGICLWNSKTGKLLAYHSEHGDPAKVHWDKQRKRVFVLWEVRRGDGFVRTIDYGYPMLIAETKRAISIHLNTQAITNIVSEYLFI